VLLAVADRVTVAVRVASALIGPPATVAEAVIAAVPVTVAVTA
jgi:hypothetical protein